MNKGAVEISNARQDGSTAAMECFALMMFSDHYEMRFVDRLSDNEQTIIAGWGKHLSGVDIYGLRWRDKQHYVLCYIGGHLVAKAGILKHHLVVGGASVCVGGVGGVVTMPAAQKCGYGTATMSYTAMQLRDRLKTPFGFLFCRNVLIPFYERLGWHRVYDPVKINQPTGSITCPLPAMFLPCSSLKWPGGAINLNSDPW